MRMIGLRGGGVRFQAKGRWPGRGGSPGGIRVMTMRQTSGERKEGKPALSR